MTRMYVATGTALAVLDHRNDRTGGAGGAWQAELRLVGLPTQCVAADPLRPERVYCGTFGRGLWRSDDAGDSWVPVGQDEHGPLDGRDIPYGEVMSVAVSASERVGGYGVVWAGTEPSAIFRSEDCGRSWQERPALREVPSAPTWSFPPRPWTSHVRWIAPDPAAPARLFAGIEAGGVMRSLDAGQTWEDSKPGAQRDCHTLATHPMAPGRVYEASGGGYAQSVDAGATWQRIDEGLAWRYLWGLAVDPADPETIVVSASRSARQAHDPAAAEATLYRRAAGTPWQEVRAGLPEARGTTACVVATNMAEAGVFYAAPHQGGIYRSADAGQKWEALEIAWPVGHRPLHITGLVVVEAD